MNNRTIPLAVTADRTLKAYIYVSHVMYFVEAFLIVAGNILTLIAVKRTKKLRQLAANTFIVSLAFADGMIGVTMIPVKLTYLTYAQNTWMISACLFRGPYYAVLCISLSTLLAIAIDRYVAVVHPLFYRRTMTIKIARIISVAIWTAQLVVWETLTCFYGSRARVEKYRPRAAHDLFPKNVSLALTQTMILLPIAGNVVVYTLIYITLKRKRALVSAFDENRTTTTDNNQPSRRTKAFTKMMALVLGYLVIAWLPYYVLVPIYKVGDPSTPSWYIYAFYAAISLFYSNSFMNPVIYSWKNRDFRDAYKVLVRCQRSVTADDAETVINGVSTPVV